MRRPAAVGVRSRVLRAPAPLRRSRVDRGAATAETMMVIPVLVAVTMGMVWLVALAGTQIRVLDAAREVARAVARDERHATAVALGRRVAPAGAEFDVRSGDGMVTVTVTSRVRGPGGIFRFLPALEVDARAVAAQER